MTTPAGCVLLQWHCCVAAAAAVYSSKTAQQQNCTVVPVAPFTHIRPEQTAVVALYSSSIVVVINSRSSHVRALSSTTNPSDR